MENFVSDEEQALIQMVFTLESNSDAVNLGAEFSGSTLTLTSLTDDYNTSVPIVLSLSVTDGEYTVSADMNVFIDPVNDAPVLSEIGTQTTSEDVPLSLTLSADDIDGDDLTFDALSGFPQDVSVNISGDELTMVPADDFNGEVVISISVTDGEYTDNTVFTLTVLPVNDAPTIYLPESFTFEEDGSYTEDFSIYVDDIDEDNLSLSVTGNENVQVEISGFTVSFSSNVDWNGTETLTFMVDDFQGRAIATDDMEVVVTPVNDAPVLSDIDDQQTNEDTDIVITLSAEDVDGDALTYTAETAELNLTVKVTDDLLVMTPEVNWNGSADVTVTVSDGFLSDSETFTLTVIPVNDAPVAEDAAIFPSVPLETDDLSLSYVYTDLEDDPESGTEISWYMTVSYTHLTLPTNREV